MSTDIADTDIFGQNMVKKYLHYDVLFFRLLAQQLFSDFL